MAGRIEQHHRVAAAGGDGNVAIGVKGEVDGPRGMALEVGGKLRPQPLRHARALRVEEVQRRVVAHGGDDGAARMHHQVGRRAGQAERGSVVGMQHAAVGIEAPQLSIDAEPQLAAWRGDQGAGAQQLARGHRGVDR